MNIDTTSISLTLDSPILTEWFGVVITLELTTMKGKPYTIHVNQCFPKVATPFLQKPETLNDLISYIIHRQHPQIQYIAVMNGIKVMHYHERPSFGQSMAAIEYDPITKTLHV